MAEAVKADMSSNLSRPRPPTPTRIGDRGCRPDVAQFFRQRPSGFRRDPDAATICFDGPRRLGPTHRNLSRKRRGAVSGLAMEIAASAKSGKTRFEIRLDPAELGRIDVRIDVDRHGQVTSHLTVERPETLSMLRQDANQLQRALDNAGLSTGNGGLQFSLRDQSSQGQNDGNQSNPNAHRLVVGEEDSVPALSPAELWPHARCERRRRYQGLRESAMAVDATMPTTVVSAPGPAPPNEQQDRFRRQRRGSRITSRPS